MNILGTYMHDHPEVVDALGSAGERVPFGLLQEALAALEFPFALTSPQIDDALAANPELGGLLQEAYLPVVPLEHWREAIERAEAVHPLSESDWVVYAAAKERPTGFTLPQDGDPILRVSLFTRTEGRVGRVSVDYANGPSLPTGLSAGVNECSLPDWGRCEQNGGPCDGECKAGRAFGPERMICRCTPS